jgi:hypothetical protein
MSREGPKIRTVTVFDSDNPKHRKVFTIIWYPLIFVLYGLGIYLVLAHPPIDVYKLFEYTVLFVSVLVISIITSSGLLQKPKVQYSPLWVTLMTFLSCIIIYPVLTHPPVDYFNVFVLAACFAFMIYTQIKTIARQRKTTGNGYN